MIPSLWSVYQQAPWYQDLEGYHFQYINYLCLKPARHSWNGLSLDSSMNLRLIADGSWIKIQVHHCMKLLKRSVAFSVLCETDFKHQYNPMCIISNILFSLNVINLLIAFRSMRYYLSISSFSNRPGAWLDISILKYILHNKVNIREVKISSDISVYRIDIECELNIVYENLLKPTSNDRHQKLISSSNIAPIGVIF